MRLGVRLHIVIETVGRAAWVLLHYHCVLRPLQGVDALLVGQLPVLVPA
jgi:hypothetical protein